ncbi:MAG: hypothetical protein V4717_12920 [Bacteroidota bacterium]
MRSVFIAFNLCLFIFVSTNCLSKDIKYVPGFYIGNNGDTVNGFFQVKDYNLPTIIKFKKDLLQEEGTWLSVDTCKALVVNQEAYVVWYGKRGMCYINQMDLNLVNIDSFRTERIPLKLIYHGNALSLYLYHDVTDHFFVGTGEAIHELSISYRYLTDWEKLRFRVKPPTYLITPTFHSQLIDLMGETLTNKQSHLIEVSQYDSYSLMKLFRKLD